MRFAATSTAVGLTLMSAYFLYSETISTRRLEQKVHSLEREREKIETEIAVLKAERAWHLRPGRIEAAARAHGLRPAQAGDYVGLVALTGAGGVGDRGSRPGSQ